MNGSDIVGWIENPIHKTNIVNGISNAFYGHDLLKTEFEKVRNPGEAYTVYRTLGQTLKKEKRDSLTRNHRKEDFTNIPGESDSILCSSNRAAACEFFADAIEQGKVKYEFKDENDCTGWLKTFAVIHDWETYLLSLVAAVVNGNEEHFEERLPSETGEFIVEMLSRVDGLAGGLAKLNEKNPQFPEQIRTEIEQDLSYLNERLNYFITNYKNLTIGEASIILKSLFLAVAGIICSLEEYLFFKPDSVKTTMEGIRKQVFTTTGPKLIAHYRDKPLY
ncbi:MAG: hypothetical protein WC604_03335 [Candidatus Gracilibacteria bacterium]